MISERDIRRMSKSLSKGQKVRKGTEIEAQETMYRGPESGSGNSKLPKGAHLLTHGL